MFFKIRFRVTGTSLDQGNSQVQTVTLTYDALGNIKTKTGVGTYSYGSQCGAGSRFNAVCNITAGSVGTKTASYSYDANGNLLSGDGRTVTWSAFDKPLSISQSGASSTMTYGAERNLITKSETTGGNTTSTVYSGGYEKVTLPGNITEERHNIAGNTVVTYTNRTAGSAGTLKTRYLHKDHLGSVTVITNESGNEVEAFSFDPWGKRRAMSLAQLQSILGNWSTLDANQRRNLTIGAQTLTSAITDKGFTGHRQLDSVGLIHMGGRVYDAEIGRFLSADPFVQDSTNLQALNRYSYVQNNPLSYTDPSGYFLKSLFKKVGKALSNAWQSIWDGAIKPVLQKIGRAFAEVPGLSAFAAAVACTAGPWTCATVGKFMLGLNAAITAANGGTLGQIVTDLAIGGVAFGIPGMGDGLAGQLNGVIKNELASVMVMGGIVSKAMGGKFIDGMKGAAIGAAAGAIGRGYGSAKQAGVSILGEITHELRVLAGARPPASAGIVGIELLNSGQQMAVSAPQVIAPPQLFYRAAPQQSTGGWEAGLMTDSAYQAGAYNIASQERTAAARSVFNNTIIAGATYSLGGALGSAGKWALSTPIGRTYTYQALTVLAEYQGSTWVSGSVSTFVGRFAAADAVVGSSTVPHLIVRPPYKVLQTP
ncbi:MAG: RHS repeat-associated core domain-containing protein [Porticoccaceae bacterium]|nr:RHS repeat-associated core domain-containing protein [Porticoccaceae bacterium]